MSEESLCVVCGEEGAKYVGVSPDLLSYEEPLCVACAADMLLSAAKANGLIPEPEDDGFAGVKRKMPTEKEEQEWLAELQLEGFDRSVAHLAWLTMQQDKGNPIDTEALLRAVAVRLPGCLTKKGTPLGVEDAVGLGYDEAAERVVASLPLRCAPCALLKASDRTCMEPHNAVRRRSHGCSKERNAPTPQDIELAISDVMMEGRQVYWLYACKGCHYKSGRSCNCPSEAIRSMQQCGARYPKP